MMFWVKVIRTPEGVLVNACDVELLGREFRDGDVVLRISRWFYGGEQIDEVKLGELLRDGDLISLVGEKCIAVAVKMGMVEWRHVKRVSGVPHINIYKL